MKKSELRPRRILVLSASVGAGHMRAAQAVELALRELDPTAEILNLDVLTLTNSAFRRVYGEAYLELVNKAPAVLGYFYDLLDRPVGKAGAVGDRLRLAMERLNLSSLTEVLCGRPWDVFVNTHFMPAEIIAALKKKRKLARPQLTITTDFDTHRLWVNPPCERYTTATEEGAAYLRHWGVPAEAVSVTGIPIHPDFSRLPARPAARKGGRPAVLQLAGGFGVGPIEETYRGLLGIGAPLSVTVVAGRNEAVRRRLERVPVPGRHRARVVGFTDRIQELMSAADLVVSKPGGLTTSEVLASGAAMAILNPIPGQESRNSDYLLENGAAVKLGNLGVMGEKLGRLLGDPRRLADLQSGARRLAKPRAAFDAARQALELAAR